MSFIPMGHLLPIDSRSPMARHLSLKDQAAPGHASTAHLPRVPDEAFSALLRHDKRGHDLAKTNYFEGVEYWRTRRAWAAVFEMEQNLGCGVDVERMWSPRIAAFGRW